MPVAVRLRNGGLPGLPGRAEAFLADGSRCGYVPPAYCCRVVTMSLPRRAAQAVAESRGSEWVADAQGLVYAPVLEWAQGSPLHSDVLGHSLHPVLTDLTLGCWTSATLLDVVGGPTSRHGATLLA